MNRTMSIDSKNRIALFCGALALIFAIFSFAGCDSIEDTFHPGGGGLNPVESAAFPSVVGNYMLTITLTGGAYAAAPTLSQFVITTPGTSGFPSLTGGRVVRLSDTEVNITGLSAVTAAGSGQKITVAAAALASQASSAAVVASGIGGFGLNPVESAGFTSVVDDNTLTITLTHGTFMPQTGLFLSQFAITTPGTPGFTNLTGGTVLRLSDTGVIITGLSAVTAAGSGQKITVDADALASQATAVTVAASRLSPVESAAFTSVVGNYTLTITLTGGTFAPQAGRLALSQFAITTPGTPGFTSLTGGTVTRTSNTVVRITGLSAVTAAGSGQKITVPAAALATQATAVTVVASGGSRVVSTLAGGSAYGNADGTGTAARFDYPSGITTDGSGNLYVADYRNHSIRKIVIASGVVTTIAGSGTAGSADGMGTAAQFNYPYDITTDGSGNLYVADNGNHRIRKIVIASGAVTTLAGSTQGYADGTGTAAQFNAPDGITTDGSRYLYVADSGNHRIRKIVIASGAVTTLAGSGTQGYADGTGTAARFWSPTGITTDGSENLYVADYGNHRIRKIVIASGAVTTLAGSIYGYADGMGTAAWFRNPDGITTDGGGNLYVADSVNNRIRKIVISSGVVTTFAGSGTRGYADGTGTAARFWSPTGITTDGSGNLYVTDRYNARIRQIEP
ncbi:hypothetical protein AGMMS49944_26020 [Spirochaetia bacterium]|nr:hypothetical protein AGMMS49944_26020 [Spirochaetia bacterium]